MYLIYIKLYISFRQAGSGTESGSEINTKARSKSGIRYKKNFGSKKINNMQKPEEQI
jgi:hypothetical protein